jgi:hypothetical protein
VIDAEIALRHQFFHIAQAEAKPEIATNTKNDNVRFEMSALEQCWPLPLHRPQAYQTRSAALQHYRFAGGPQDEIAGLR